MQNYLICISYSGKNYAGYQIQNNANTVGAEIFSALKSVFEEVFDLHGCSRTDSGVHANNYYVSFKSEKLLEEDAVVRAVNSKLPDDISVKSCEYKPDDFHARYSVKRKEYIYKIYNGKTRDPFYKDFSYFVPGKIDVEKMNRAAKFLIGKHDFAPFMASGSKIEDTVRTIYYAEFERKDDFVIFKICGDGFLYKMVRLIVGTLLYVSDGKLKEEDIARFFDENIKTTGFAAPPHGLFLNRVDYEG